MTNYVACTADPCCAVDCVISLFVPSFDLLNNLLCVQSKCFNRLVNDACQTALDIVAWFELSNSFLWALLKYLICGKLDLGPFKWYFRVIKNIVTPFYSAPSRKYSAKKAYFINLLENRVFLDFQMSCDELFLYDWT